MCHPSLDVPFEQPSSFSEQQLSCHRAVTVPECHRWGQELWLHPTGVTWAGRGEPTLLETLLQSWNSRNPQQQSAHMAESGQLQHLPLAPGDSCYPQSSLCWVANRAHAAPIGAHSTFWRCSLPRQESGLGLQTKAQPGNPCGQGGEEEEEPQIPAGRGAADPSWKRSCRSWQADAAPWCHRCQSGHGVMTNAPPAQARKHQFALENKD